MSSLLSIITVILLGYLVYLRVSLFITGIVTLASLLVLILLIKSAWLLLLLIPLGIVFCIACIPSLRKKFITGPLFSQLKTSLPTLSSTEKVALEAGTVSWDSELFNGQLKWDKLLHYPEPTLTQKERNFIDGPLKTLCGLINDWEITHKYYDLPPHIWQFIKEEGFFGFIIPESYGGLGFSAFAHSEILTILAAHSLTLSSIVAVPNSLGPAELLLHYGTQEQQDYYLPRLAKGIDVPCFALTSPTAGSDATSIIDNGIICEGEGEFEDKKVIGIRLNWNKRYITLAPVSTLLGVAFKLFDPEGLVGSNQDLGITCALIPTHLPGITIGRRHFPSGSPFQNGPTQGKDVFIPLDYIIGGIKMAGEGWRMLVECLATGRAISLPAGSSGCARMAVVATSAYTKIRYQFRQPICNFEGVQEVLCRMVGLSYLSEGMRKLTVSLIDLGEKPAVLGAITKYNVTEWSRKIINDAMDIHGGKGIMQGPHNYLSNAYQGTPVGITVEGANILTRGLIIFGQGSVRCHPFILKEMKALQQEKFSEFESLIQQHISFTFSNVVGAFFHGLTGAKLVRPPKKVKYEYCYQQLTRASQAFALIADLLLGVIGGKLKFKEMLSGRLADLLGMLYAMSAILKQDKNHQHPESDEAIVKWSFHYCLMNYWHIVDNLLLQLKPRWLAWLLRAITMPLGRPQYRLDELVKKVVQSVTDSQDARARLGGETFKLPLPLGLSHLEKAFAQTFSQKALIEGLQQKLKTKEFKGSTFKEMIDYGLSHQFISEQESEGLNQLNSLWQTCIQVDDFEHLS